MAGWLIASLPTVAAIVLWRGYGGSIYPPELATVAFGHLLNAGLTIALAAAAASLTDHPSTAAIVTLSVTVGTWIVNFIAAVQGGVWERAAGYTPTAMVAEFQHGLRAPRRRADRRHALLFAARALGDLDAKRRRRPPARRRIARPRRVATVAVLVLHAPSTTSWDLSEKPVQLVPAPTRRLLAGFARRSRYRGASGAGRSAPRRSRAPGALEAAPRAAGVDVQYVANTITGLFEQTAEHYGEIWYSSTAGAR